MPGFRLRAVLIILMGSGACEVRALRCGVSPREISMFSVHIFKFNNMQICKVFQPVSG